MPELLHPLLILTFFLFFFVLPPLLVQLLLFVPSFHHIAHSLPRQVVPSASA